MFSATIIVGDLDQDTPEAAALAAVEWIRSNADPVFVEVKDQTGIRDMVRVDPSDDA